MSDIIIPTPPAPEEPGIKHVTFVDGQGKAVGHLSAFTRAQIAENTPSGCTVVEGHQPLFRLPKPLQIEVDSDRAKTMIENLEKQQARAIRENAIGRGGTQQELKARLEIIDDQITVLRGKIV